MDCTARAAALTLGLKALEREGNDDPSALAGVALGLPALLRAEKIQKRAARTGFDWPDANGAKAKVFEEIAEVEGHRPLQDQEDDDEHVGHRRVEVPAQLPFRDGPDVTKSFVHSGQKFMGWACDSSPSEVAGQLRSLFRRSTQPCPVG